jgi:hypothetical protein
MNWTTVINKMKEFLDMRLAINSQYNAYWTDNILFTWRWWLKVAMLVFPWALWFFVRKKESTVRMLLAGFFVVAFSFILDEIGYNLGLWYYVIRIIPFIPTNIAYNLGALPVAAMLFIQFFPKVKPAYKALVFALLGAFVAEPAMVWLGLYRNVHWAYWYSFPLLFIQYWIAHRLALMKSFEPMT